MSVIFILAAASPSVAAQASVMGSALRSSGFAKLILFILFMISAVSWAVVVYKYRVLRNADLETKPFLKNLPKSKSDPARLMSLCKKFKNSHISRILRAGYLESGNSSLMYKKTKAAGEEIKDHIDNAISDEVVRLEEMLVILAIAASASPLLGLLGTVWGVMGSFLGMEAHQAASISAVAPGISDALVTTIAGLATAIPAVIAYNYFVNRIKVMTSEMENFAHRFSNGFFAAKE